MYNKPVILTLFIKINLITYLKCGPNFHVNLKTVKNCCVWFMRGQKLLSWYGLNRILLAFDRILLAQDQANGWHLFYFQTGNVTLLSYGRKMQPNSYSEYTGTYMLLKSVKPNVLTVHRMLL